MSWPHPMAHHRIMMDGYFAWVSAWEAEAEAVAMGYPSEYAEYKKTNPRPTFKAWLIGQRRYETPPRIGIQDRVLDELVQPVDPEAHDSAA